MFERYTDYTVSHRQSSAREAHRFGTNGYQVDWTRKPLSHAIRREVITHIYYAPARRFVRPINYHNESYQCICLFPAELAPEGPAMTLLFLQHHFLEPWQGPVGVLEPGSSLQLGFVFSLHFIPFLVFSVRFHLVVSIYLILSGLPTCVLPYTCCE